MAQPAIHRLSVCISAHAWSGDKSRVAVSPNNNEVIIYKKEGSNLVVEHTLRQHDSVVTGIDWGSKTNRIVTCSQDRNAYVWTFQDNEWKPVLVILRINRSATACQWSPREDKFAVASGAKCISICYFETEQNWWVSKHIKTDIESTITSIDWHPNNVLIAAGGTDSKARVFSGFVKGLDKREDVGTTAFGNKLPFGIKVAEWNTAGWVQAIKWNASGNQLCWVSQDSSIHFLNCATSDHKLSTQATPYLPFRDMVWIGDNKVVAVGHDPNPTLFVNSGDSWKLDKQLDKGVAAKTGDLSAKDKFQNMAKLGSADAAGDRTLDTRHQNCVSIIRIIDNKTLSTSGLDGNLIVWPFPSLQL